MEMIKVPKIKFEKMEKELKILKELEGIDFELLSHFRRSLEDVKEGRIRRVA